MGGAGSTAIGGHSDVIHRAATTCAPPSASGGTANTAVDAGTVPDTCTTNSDCSALPNGYCQQPGAAEQYHLGAKPHCVSGCFQDSDCGATGVCSCSTEPGPFACVPADCHVDGDCGPNSLCALDVIGFCGDAVGYFCSKPTDECLTAADCKSGGNCIGRHCDSQVCGRPFIVAQAPRWAKLAERADWNQASVTPNVRALSAQQRAQLHAHWARLGQMEHASIAAFARFSLQLLSLAAPPELVEACTTALADETKHTRLCFALASAYGGSAVGPGPLEVRDCFEDVSLSGIAKLVIREGCIGETVAALEALEAASAAQDPTVKAVLSQIARDEQRHAELAFKFLHWVLEQAPGLHAELAQDAELALLETERATAAHMNEPADGLLAAHGLPGSAARSTAQRSALQHVVRPLLSAVFAPAHFERRHCAEPGVVATTA